MTAVTDGERLDLALVRRGLAASRTRAAAMVAEGHVRVGGVRARRAAQSVEPTSPIEVDGVHDDVSRGARKLRGAFDALGGAGAAPAVRGRHCLDAGASTGGFTQVLLERGAARVLAVDVGHGQLAPRIAEDARVVSIEGLNVRDLGPADVPGPVDLAVGDMSFISLALVLDPLLSVMAPGGDLLLLVKPQFEVGRGRLGTGGVVTDPDARARAVQAVAEAAIRAGAVVRGVVPSALAGASGNQETFLWLRAPVHGGATTPDDAPAPHGDAEVPDLLDAVGLAVARNTVLLVDGRAVG